MTLEMRYKRAEIRDLFLANETMCPIRHCEALKEPWQSIPFCKGGCLRSRQGDFNNPLFSHLSSLISKVLLLTNAVAGGIA